MVIRKKLKCMKMMVIGIYIYWKLFLIRYLYVNNYIFYL